MAMDFFSPPDNNGHGQWTRHFSLQFRQENAAPSAVCNFSKNRFSPLFPLFANSVCQHSQCRTETFNYLSFQNDNYFVYLFLVLFVGIL